MSWLAFVTPNNVVGTTRSSNNPTRCNGRVSLLRGLPNIERMKLRQVRNRMGNMERLLLRESSAERTRVVSPLVQHSHAPLCRTMKEIGRKAKISYPKHRI